MIKCQKRAATHDAYKATNQLRMAARRAHGYGSERPGCSFLDMKISDLFLLSHLHNVHNQMTDDIHSHRGWSCT